MRQFDQIIIGQGIAGSALAWQFHWRGLHVAIIDRCEEVTASKIASGLISPITGKRNAVSWRFAAFWEAAEPFYRRVEETTQERLLRQQPMLKVLTESSALDSPSLVPFKQGTEQLAEPLNANLDAAILSPAAKLDVPAYLLATRDYFARRGCFFEADVDPAEDVALVKDGVELTPLQLSAKQFVFCQGIAAHVNPWLDQVTFEPAKGEILTIDCPSLAEDRVVHGDVWLAPAKDHRFQVGATYEHAFENDQPSKAGREELLQKLSELLPNNSAAHEACPYEIVDHQAAVRPVVRGRQPLIGIDRTEPRIAHMNGLGSKGALQSPLLAKQLVRQILDGANIDHDFWLYRTTEEKSPKKLTVLAHELVAEAIAPGDFVVDATAGNGYDTLFLANQVGPTGRVMGIDLQPTAIERTAGRIATAGVTNVSLHVDSHDRLSQLVPTEFQGQVAAVMFNLGYLPRGDKTVITATESTIEAVFQSLEMLKSGGVVSIMAYTGHDGGLSETLAVQELIESLSKDQFRCFSPTPNKTDGAPRLFLITKQ